MTSNEPPVMPYEFWASPRFRAAFESRDMGKIFRLYRTSQEHRGRFGPDGITQELLATWLGISQAQISSIERGKKDVDSLSNLIYWAEILSIPNDLLWFDLTNRSRIMAAEDADTDAPQATTTRHEPNTKLRTARESTPSPATPGFSMSRAELAEAVNEYLWRTTKKVYTSLDARHIGRFERGEIAWPTAAYRNALRSILGAATDADLGFYPKRKGSTARAPLGPKTNSTGENQESATSGEEIDLLRRREFIGATAGSLLSMSPTFHPDLRFNAGESDVRYLLERTARLRRLDNYLGGRDTYHTYFSELTSTIDYVRNVSTKPSIRTRLFSVVAEQAQLAGWAAFDAGMHGEAKQHYRDSLDAAKQASDAALLGNAMAFLAYQEVSVASPNVELAEASFAAAEKEATPRVRALLLERKAWTHAVAKDRRATERSLNEARIALQANPGQQEPDWVFWVDETEIDIMTGRCWAELGHPSKAIPTLETALTRFDSTHARDKALYTTWLAHALIDNKEIERATAATLESIDLAKGVASVRPNNRISGVVHRLRKHRSLPFVDTFFEQIRG